MSDQSTHQLVGVVTKMFPTFGYINNQIFFQRKCVIGPMVEVGDNVATSAVYQPNMPIKWSAEKVWRIQDSSSTTGKDDAEKSVTKSPVRLKESRSSRDTSKTRDSIVSVERKRRVSPDRRDTGSINRNEDKRRRLSPGHHSSRSPIRHGRSRSPMRRGRVFDVLPPKALLNVKEMIVPVIHYQFPCLLPPVDLYRLVCHWQDSFPLLKPLQPDRSTLFQVIKYNGVELSEKSKEDTGFYVNVLLLSMPSVTSLYDKTIIRAEGPKQDKTSVPKCVKILSASKSKGLFKAFGGPWNPELDGPEPARDPKVLIKTAIRICKKQLGLDLSFCTQWHRFLEFRYSRTEGSTARPTSVLFPGSHLWGRSFSVANSQDSIAKKPFHRIVIYFIPDIWSLMPSSDAWTNIKDAMEVALSGGTKQNFPLSTDELKTYVGQKEEDVSMPMKKDVSSENVGGVSATPVESTQDKSGSTSSLTAAKESLVDKDTSISETNTSVTQGQTDVNSALSSGAVDEAANNDSAKRPHDDMNLTAMKVSELREQLKARNLPADGIKAQLLSRLKTAVEREVEAAKKLLEEKKRKEKELQEAIALKEEEEKKRQSLKPVEATPVPQPTSVSLRNYPSIVVQNRLSAEHTIQAVSLQDIVDARSDAMDSRGYEFIICAHSLLNMFRRDSIFTLFRAMVSAADRGVQAKSRPRSAHDRHSQSRDPKVDIPKDAIPFTVDVPLLFACTYLDPAHREYFTSEEVEEMLSTLGLPASRYQIRSLITKVADGHRIFYRSLCDAEVSPSTVKSTSVFSEIDDDEYLLELIRGGDAILEDLKDTQLPLGSVLVIPDPTLDDSVLSADANNERASLNLSNSLCRIEFEKNKLKKQLQNKIEEIERLRALTEKIPILSEKLTSANTIITDYKRRYQSERDRTHYANRIIEQQVNCLESSRSALRQLAHRLRPRTLESKKRTPSRTRSPDSPARSSKSAVSVTSEKKLEAIKTPELVTVECQGKPELQPTSQLSVSKVESVSSQDVVMTQQDSSSELPKETMVNGESTETVSPVD